MFTRFLDGAPMLETEGKRTILLLSCILRHAMDPFIRPYALSLLLWMMKGTHAMLGCSVPVKQRLENFRFQLQVALHAESLLCKENRGGLKAMLRVLRESLQRDEAVDGIMIAHQWTKFRAPALEFVAQLSVFLKLQPWYEDVQDEDDKVPVRLHLLPDEVGSWLWLCVCVCVCVCVWLCTHVFVYAHMWGMRVCVFFVFAWRFVLRARSAQRLAGGQAPSAQCFVAQWYIACSA
jgi:hypothetical protein